MTPCVPKHVGGSEEQVEISEKNAFSWFATLVNNYRTQCTVCTILYLVSVKGRRLSKVFFPFYGFVRLCGDGSINWPKHVAVGVMNT
jgi:hypothetical protein